MHQQAPFGLKAGGRNQPKPDTAAGTQRAHERFPWDRDVQVSWLSDEAPGEPTLVHTSDISAGGLSLLTRGMVHPGRRGVVLLVKKGGEAMLRCFEVIHCRYVGQSRHVVGARWIVMPSHCPLAIENTENGPRLYIKKWD